MLRIAESSGSFRCLVGAKLFLCALLGVVVAGNAAAAGDPPLAEFKARYEVVMRAVAEGRLPPAAGSAARELWLALRKYVIQSDARIETLRLDARERRGEEQDRALDALVAEAMERTRAVGEFLNKLERLENQNGTPERPDAALSNEPQERASQDRGEPTAGPEDRTRKPVIDVRFEPENIITTEQTME